MTESRYLWAILITSALMTAFSIWYMMDGYSISTVMAVEDAGEQALGVKVTVGNLNVDEEHDMIHVGGMLVFNPGKKFSDGAAFQIDTIDVLLGPKQPGLLHIKTIKVSGVQHNLEVLPEMNNLHTIDALANAGGNKTKGEYSRYIRVKIDNIEIDGIQVRPRTLQDKAISQAIVPVETIHLTGLGAIEAEGLPVREAIAIVWSALQGNISATAQRSGFFDGMKLMHGASIDEELPNDLSADVEAPAAAH